ncbi:hypothetical protein J7T55_011177 [Diaporthe amygdali]|uniref:uncharacterized protein n=1 Tax=Phomopsis amygdali TaxID=1214568 RepID=UPI0022FEAF89|nr:uncharacterized protein J7T55_011177 [Diaporthe amygdali]KAJ0104392.1 hypothetical protein J7T55_011177 [Diaporthe amygdali]
MSSLPTSGPVGVFRHMITAPASETAGLSSAAQLLGLPSQNDMRPLRATTTRAYVTRVTLDSASSLTIALRQSGSLILRLQRPCSAPRPMAFENRAFSDV